MQREQDLTPEQVRQERAKLWRAYRKAKAVATDARSMMAAADLLGRAVVFDEKHPPRRRTAR
jgi:hypothetical protein